MSFLTMEDSAYIDGLIGIYELNNVSLLREVYIDAYLTSAEKYRTLRAENSRRRPVATKDLRYETVNHLI